MLVIPTAAVPSQVLAVTLANQACRINVYQKTTGLYLDLYISDTLILGGVLCENLNRIVRDAYFGFIGDLAFNDTQGTDDPVYTGLGTRWVLLYLEAADLVSWEGQ